MLIANTEWESKLPFLQLRLSSLERLAAIEEAFGCDHDDDGAVVFVSGRTEELLFGVFAEPDTNESFGQDAFVSRVPGRPPRLLVRSSKAVFAFELPFE